MIASIIKKMRAHSFFFFYRKEQTEVIDSCGHKCYQELVIHCFACGAIHITQTCLCDETFKSNHQITFTWECGWLGMRPGNSSKRRCPPHIPDHSKATWLNFVSEIVQLKLWVYHFPRIIMPFMQLCRHHMYIGSYDWFIGSCD